MSSLSDMLLGDTSALAASWSNPFAAISNDLSALWHNNGQNVVVGSNGSTTGVDGYAGAGNPGTDALADLSTDDSDDGLSGWTIGLFAVLVIFLLFGAGFLLKEAREI